MVVNSSLLRISEVPASQLEGETSTLLYHLVLQSLAFLCLQIYRWSLFFLLLIHIKFVHFRLYL